MSKRDDKVVCCLNCRNASVTGDNEPCLSCMQTEERMNFVSKFGDEL